MSEDLSTESKRLNESNEEVKDWKKWGPYISDRAWGTVREDYSEWGNAWEHFPYDQARSRAFRWSEDGIGGICNTYQNLCFALAFWNEKDDHLKERFFGLANEEGNHGEDVKEYYFYIDNTPTHSYMKMLYKYPQVKFPYEKLREVNKSRGKEEPEYELFDALKDEFLEKKYFDITIEYAKYEPDDIVCRITVENKHKDEAKIHIIPQLWFRNNWHWGYLTEKPTMHQMEDGAVLCEGKHIGKMYLYCEDEYHKTPEFHFTDNETNFELCFGKDNISVYTKDGINDVIVNNDTSKVNPEKEGTKVGGQFIREVAGNGTYITYVRLTDKFLEQPFNEIDKIFLLRIDEANEFYDSVHDAGLDYDERQVQREAFAGLLWSKQFFHYSPQLWYSSDPKSFAVNPLEIQRKHTRNKRWKHLYNLHIISMPDKWEYPWYAVWDLAFHTIPLAMIDSEFAKSQLLLFLTEDYLHPNGQMPAYEWNFEDVNPPVHAWAVWRVYNIERNMRGSGDVQFLETAFHKLLLNFTWWVNCKDVSGDNVFEGGFLGMDNIGVFDRSHELPSGGKLEQADGTAWMAMFCLNMLAIAFELALHNISYQHTAIKFLDHFLLIANTMSSVQNKGRGLWNEEDGFFYDVLKLPDNSRVPLKIKSFVGLIPLFAVETIEEEWLTLLPRFKARLEWYMKYRKNIIKNIAPLDKKGRKERLLLSIVDAGKLKRILKCLLNEDHFLSSFGFRTLSKFHAANPYVFNIDGVENSISFEPAESRESMFGGNSNWRGPIWFPVNFLMLESLQKFHHYYGDELQVEFPENSSSYVDLKTISINVAKRLCQIFLKDKNGERPVYHGKAVFQNSEWSNHILFYEYFNADTGEGLGACHQTGWTALVAKLLQQCCASSMKCKDQTLFLRPQEDVIDHVRINNVQN